MKVSIVIPVYNEASTVCELLHRVWEQALPTDERELIIIESGSSDGTREAVLYFADGKNREKPGSVKVILQPKPLGKGNALQEGFRETTGDIILIQDGDLEYDVRDYPILLQPILDGRAQFVLGSRHLAAGSWKIRSFDQNNHYSFLLNLGGIFFHTFFNLLYRQTLTDPTTMYKVFRKSCLNGISFSSNRFDFDFELVAKLIRSGFKPLEVPVSYKSRGFNEGKKINVVRDPFLWLWAIVKFRFSRLHCREKEGILAHPVAELPG